VQKDHLSVHENLSYLHSSVRIVTVNISEPDD
jgi:hypothetical protein